MGMQSLPTFFLRPICRCPLCELSCSSLEFLLWCDLEKDLLDSSDVGCCEVGDRPLFFDVEAGGRRGFCLLLVLLLVVVFGIVVSLRRNNENARFSASRIPSFVTCFATTPIGYTLLFSL